MGLNICLFVHGVPHGYKSWGPVSDYDNRYVSSFYGPTWDVQELLKVEIKTLGGGHNCYYTFIKSGNVFDNGGRPGSFFALTLKTNAFYADVQNVYNILRAAYDKMCIGLCVNEYNGRVNYVIENFNQIDKQLKAIEQQVLHYIGEFSVGNDIVEFAALQNRENNLLKKINLFECSKQIAISSIRQASMYVSPYYRSSDIAKLIDDCEKDKRAITQKANDSIQQCKADCDLRIQTITEQQTERLEAEQKRNAALHAENTGLNAQVSKLQKQVRQMGQLKKEKERENADLRKKIEQNNIPENKCSPEAHHKKSQSSTEGDDTHPDGPADAGDDVCNGKQWYNKLATILTDNRFVKILQDDKIFSSILLSLFIYVVILLLIIILINMNTKLDYDETYYNFFDGVVACGWLSVQETGAFIL